MPKWWAASFSFIKHWWMREALVIIFSVCTLLIAHTYFLYPVVMMLLFKKPRTKVDSFNPGDDLPEVGVLIAAFNEEKVIRNKILSVFNTGYPADKINVYVGSDASFDGTEPIIQELQAAYPRLKLQKFKDRVGKISIINHLQSLGNAEILILTDANVIFTKNTIFELVRSFKDERVGIVAANIVKHSAHDEGISFQEKKYLSLENRLKAAESNAFNLIMGAEGGCYAIRNSLFSKVPQKFNVDDFYITLQVLLRDKFTLFNPSAVCVEDVATDTSGEYRRKVRISSGNFQNLMFFHRILFKFWKAAGFTFWSHKVLRWFTPFFLLGAWLSSALLAPHYELFLWLFILQSVGFLAPAFDRMLNFRVKLLKFISHFYLMNLALLDGFFRYVKGIQSSIWQPVKRNV
jgi:cellulose synthase/poly-beta-1,6-N-acetylglucosamine synthase-like glycosyltransferase